MSKKPKTRTATIDFAPYCECEPVVSWSLSQRKRTVAIRCVHSTFSFCVPITDNVKVRAYVGEYGEVVKTLYSVKGNS